MADTLKDREKGFEAKFRQDQELQFKATARRNRMLADWLAPKFGLTPSDKDAYAKELVAADLEKPGDEDLIAKVMADAAKRKVGIADTDLRKELARLLPLAVEQVMSERKK